MNLGFRKNPSRARILGKQWIQLFPVESRRGEKGLTSTRPPGGWSCRQSSGKRRICAEKKGKSLDRDCWRRLLQAGGLVADRGPREEPWRPSTTCIKRRRSL